LTPLGEVAGRQTEISLSDGETARPSWMAKDD
jgi:hypothetical protein